MKQKLKLDKLKNCLPALTAEALGKLESEGFFDASGELVVKRRSALSQMETLEEGERAVIRYISTRDVDRDHEVLDPAGAMLDQFLLAPQVLWAHDYSLPPIAKAEWVKADSTGLKSKTVYAETDRAEEVWQLIKGGFLATASVGFIPMARVWKGTPEWTPVADKLNQKWDTDLEKAGAEVITTKWMLLEYSDVPVPANPHALITAIAKGLALSDEMLEQLQIPDPAGTTRIEEGNPSEKPYPNEHSCRLVDPGKFQEDSFRRTSREHEGKKYSVIMGRLKGQDTMTEQAYRYAKDVWEAAQARSHCKSHDGNFEAAKTTARIIIPMKAQPRFYQVMKVPERRIVTVIEETLDQLRGKA
jgi:phage head maturation protease